jgi:hypothetical protein
VAADTKIEEKEMQLSEVGNSINDAIPAWQSLAANAAGAILGWPHLGPETAQAAISHIARFLSRSESSTPPPQSSQK